MPNMIAYLALLAWPIVTWQIFSRLRLETALITSILASYLLLPPVAAFDPPIVPTLDKFSIATVTATIAVLVIRGGPRDLIPQDPLMRFLLLLFVASPLVTALSNSDPIQIGPVYIPALSIRDGISVLLAQTFYILPLLLGRMVLAGPEDPVRMLKALMIGIAAYAPLMLAEIRLSPQMNTWVYGFFQHEFHQMIRGDSFRPIVFLPHALWLSILTFFALAASAVLARTKEPPSNGRWFAVLGFAVLLVLCKSMASIIYGLVLVPVLLFAPAGLIARIAGAIAAATLIYPLLRGGGLVPVEMLLEQARAINPDRAQSLGFRFLNEDMLLSRANERPFFGWGLWGRGFIYDPVTGRNLTIADGSWIITITSFGWLGFISLFGMLCVPLIMLAKLRLSILNALPDKQKFALSGLALMVAVNLADLILNATLVPLTFLCTGIILGSVERLARHPVARTAPQADEPNTSALPRPRVLISPGIAPSAQGAPRCLL